MADGDTGRIADLKPIGEITDLKPIGQATVQPKTEEGALGKLWDWANRGIVSKDTFVRAISGMTPEQLNYALASYPTESPVHAAIREFVRGSIQDVGSTASGLTSPLSLGTMAAGAAGKIPGAEGTIAKAITGASAAGFGAKGASDIYQAGTEGTPEAWQQRLQGGAMLASGGAGTGEALKAVPKPGLQSAAERVYQSSLKPGPRTYTQEEVAGFNQTALNRGIPLSPSGATKLRGLIDDWNDKVWNIIKSKGPQPWQQNQPVKGLLPPAPEAIGIPASQNPPSALTEAQRITVRDPATGRMKRVYTAQPQSEIPNTPTSYYGTMNRTPEFTPSGPLSPGTTIKATDVVKRLDDLRSRIAKEANPESDLQAVDAARNEFLKYHGGDIPVLEAQEIKTKTGQKIRNSYGELSNAAKESQKALVRGLKEELEIQFPEIKGLNAEEGRMIGLDEAMDTALNRIANRNPLSLTGTIASVGLGSMAGMIRGNAAEGVGTAGAALIMHHILTDPTVQSKLAITLNHAAKTVPMSAARARVIGYANALGSSLPSNEQGTP